MSKVKTRYVCQQCGRVTLRQMGKCPQCGTFNSMIEEIVAEAPKGSVHRSPLASARSAPKRLAQIEGDAEERWQLPIAEFSRVLGGGIVPGSLVLVGGDPGIGKCVTGDTRVLDPATGDYLPITAWQDTSRKSVSIDPETLCLAPAAVSAFLVQGQQAVVCLRTRLGRELTCTPTHPVLTVRGWKSVDQLQLGDRIASPRCLPFFGTEALSEAEINLVAYILSEGSTQSNINITTSLPEVVADLEIIAKSFQVQLRRYPKRNTLAVQYRFVNSYQDRQAARAELATALRQAQQRSGIAWAEWARRAQVSYGMLNIWRRGKSAPTECELQRLADTIDYPLADLAPDARNRAENNTPLARFLERHNLRYARAAEKFVPACIFRLPRPQLALFLRKLFTGDGSVFVNQRGLAGFSYSTISRRLAEDVQHLLLRFGIVATLRTKPSLVNGEPYIAYEVSGVGVKHTQRFVSEIGIVGRTPAITALAKLAPKFESSQADTVPTGEEFWELLRDMTRGLTWRAVSRQAGVKILNRRHDRPLRRTTLARLATAFPHPRLGALGQGDVYWDEVVSIEPAGDADVYDLTVPDRANFVANDLIVHNSTLLLQMATLMAEHSGPVLYVSGEESERQIKMRALRLMQEGGQAESPAFSDNLYLVTETNLDVILAHIESVKPRLVIIDSIQTAYLQDLSSAAGSVSQVRECASRLQGLAKSSGVAIFLIGHVTKEGMLAGPRVLEHIVDTVLQLEGDRYQAFRLLRAVKNRFGATSEVGVFEMAGSGMLEVSNPSEAFLAERLVDTPGSVIAVTMEGTRPLLVEIQGLTSATTFGNPRRTPNGIDFNRLLLITAVLSKRMNLKLGDQDVFVNVVGGLKISEPAADLAIAAAITSSARDWPPLADCALIGEIGLSGELRAVSQLPQRLREAKQLGFRKVIIPRTARAREGWPDGLEVVQARSIREAVGAALMVRPDARRREADSG